MTGIQKIICPNCKTEISVDEALYIQIEKGISKKYEEFKRKDKEVLAAKAAELSKKAEEVESAKRNVDAIVDNAVKKKLEQRESEIVKQAKQDAKNEQKQIIDLMTTRASDLQVQLTKSREEQVKLMDEKQKLKDEKEAFEIEKRKQLETAREQLKEEADKKAAERYQNILSEKDKKLAKVLKLNEELKRNAEQGSQQIQGEIAELNLEEELRKTFVYDEIQPVPKGICGADVIQKVRDMSGKECGQIIWEVKNTKAWTESWIQKLKDDQREIHADVAIIISNVLPEKIKYFDSRDGVYVCDTNLAIHLARIVRDKMEAITREKNLAIGKNEKMDILYQYLTGVQFRQRIEAIVETFRSMRDDIVKEKQYYIKKWAKAEKQIEKVVHNTIGMYGDLEGMVNLPKIQTLELEYEDRECQK